MFPILLLFCIKRTVFSGRHLYFYVCLLMCPVGIKECTERFTISFPLHTRTSLGSSVTTATTVASRFFLFRILP